MNTQSSVGRAVFSKKPFNGVKVFSVTVVTDRDRLGDRITEWLNHSPKLEICEASVTQSSDKSFHCLTITLFYYEPRP